MPNYGPTASLGDNDATGFNVFRHCRATTVVQIYSEEHTPVVVGSSRRLAELGGWAATSHEWDMTPATPASASQPGEPSGLRDSVPRPNGHAHQPPVPGSRAATRPPPAPPASRTRTARISSPPPPPASTTARMVLSPDLVRTSSVSKAYALLPELAHDPHYYPGLVPGAHERLDDDLEATAARTRPKWLWHALAGAGLFAAGLTLASLRGGSETSTAASTTGTAESAKQAATPTGPQPTTTTTTPATPEATPDEVNEPAASAEQNAFATAAASSRAPAMSARELAKQRKLERRAAAAARRAQKSGSHATASAAHRSHTKAAKTPSFGAPAKASAAVSGAKTGTLQINSRPWSDVYVDNRMVGHTPQMALQLSAGHHTIKLSNPTMGLTKTLSVTIRAGETLKKIETLGG